MFRHIVLLSFKPEATPAERDAVKAALAALPGKVPEIRTFQCGDNVGKGPNHHDFATVMDFDDEPAFRRYIASDAHKAYVAGPAAAVAKLAVVQHLIQGG
jgi:hypothetical protein